MTFEMRTILSIVVTILALGLAGCEVPGLEEKQSNNARLATLSVTHVVNSSDTPTPMFPAFDPEITQYQLLLPKGPYSDNKKDIEISASAEDPAARISGDGTRSVSSGNKIVGVTVTAENGAKKEYELTAVFAEANELTKLLVYDASTGNKLGETNLLLTSWSLNVNFAVTRIRIEAVTADPTAEVVGIGEFDLENINSQYVFTVTVNPPTSADLDSKDYTVNVTRKPASTFANLDTLVVKKVGESGNYSLSPTFSSSTLVYTVNVKYNVSQVQIVATTSSASYATISGLENDGFVALENGANLVQITVTAQDGITTKTYKITINRPPISDNANLASLNFGAGSSLSPAFDSNTTEYTAFIQHFAKSFTVSATKSYAEASIIGTGTYEFTGDGQVVEVVVTAEDGITQKVYTVTVTRGNIHTFRAQKVTDGTWYNATGTLLATGEHSLVFAENGHGITPETAQEIADEFDNEIYEPIVDAFGEASDVDNNGKVVIFLLDIIDGYSGGGFVAGYFDPTHQFAKTTYANSNEMDMLFMDVDPLVPASDQFYGTLAHEFQHLINFNVAYLEGNSVEFDVWINEGLSTAAEYVYSGTIDVDGRVAWFNADPTGSISAGNNFFVWNGFWENEGDQLSNYATAYLFFQWLRIHAPNGVEIYGDIISSGSRNYQAVLSAATASGGEFPSTWSTLMQAWFLANFFGVSDESTGIFSYEGEIETLVYEYPATGSIYLSPGEGVYLQLSEAFTPLSTPEFVTYVGFTSAGVLDTLSPYSGERLLIYNSNPSISGLDVVALRPSVQADPSPLLSVTKTGIQLPESYPIGVLLQPGGGVGTLLPASPSGRPGDFGTRR